MWQRLPHGRQLDTRGKVMKDYEMNVFERIMSATPVHTEYLDSTECIFTKAYHSIMKGIIPAWCLVETGMTLRHSDSGSYLTTWSLDLTPKPLGYISQHYFVALDCPVLQSERKEHNVPSAVTDWGLACESISLTILGLSFTYIKAYPAGCTKNGK